jgi:hypothetical protein
LAHIVDELGHTLEETWADIRKNAEEVKMVIDDAYAEYALPNMMVAVRFIGQIMAALATL